MTRRIRWHCPKYLAVQGRQEYSDEPLTCCRYIVWKRVTFFRVTLSDVTLCIWLDKLGQWLAEESASLAGCRDTKYVESIHYSSKLSEI